MRTGLAIALGFASVLFAPAALAQDGDGSVEPPKVTTQVKTTTTTPAASAAPKADDGVTDHEKVVGHLGVGYLGLTQIPIGSGGGGGGGFSHSRATLDAPVIGVRYWLSEKMGLDLGLGFTMFSSSNDTVNNNVTTTTDGPAAVGVAVHGGVPLSGTRVAVRSRTETLLRRTSFAPVFASTPARASAPRSNSASSESRSSLSRRPSV
jgi:hypothetical protein